MAGTTDGLRTGQHYTRAQLHDLLGVPEDARSGNWFTGYHQHGGEWFVFAGIGTAGRTGHDYANRWDDSGQLHWHGKTNSALGQPAIVSLLAGPAHIFTREHDRDPFEYHGVGIVAGTDDTTPVTVRWRFAPKGR